MIRRVCVLRRRQDIKTLGVLQKRLRIKLGDLPSRLSIALRTDFELILALISVSHKMPHVGDVHDVRYIESVEFECPAKHVGKEISPKVPDVSKPIHRRPAGI